MKTPLKLLISFVFVVSGFLSLSQNTFARLSYDPGDFGWNPDPATYSSCTPDTKLACDNTYSNSVDNACGTSCVGLCSDSSFNQGNSNDCVAAMSSTAPWTKYSALSYSCSLWVCVPNVSCRKTEFRYYSTASVCSTADKVDPSSNNNLDFGSCSCSLGNRYKSCCQASPDGSFSNVAVSGYDADNQDPLEADCNATTTYTLSCPQPPTFTLTADKASYNIGDTANITWTVTNSPGYTLNGDSELSSVSDPTCTSDELQNITVINGKGSGKYKVTTSGQTSVSVSCVNYYGVPIPGGKAEQSTSPHTEKLTLTGGPMKCLDYNTDENKDNPYYCSAFVKNDPAFTYNNTIVGQRTPDPTGSCSVSNQSCYIDKCARCSNTPGSETTWIEWYDRNNDNCSSDWNNQRTETPNDPRCIADKYYSCSAGGSSACTLQSSPCSGSNCYKNDNTCSNKCAAPVSCSVDLKQNTSINKGGSATLTVSATNADTCTVSPGNIVVNPNAGSKQVTVTPTDTTSYTATCHTKDSADPNNTCSGSATVTVTAQQVVQGQIVSPSQNISVSFPTVTPETQCLPQRDVTFSDFIDWNVSTPNNCKDIIGGGTPSSSDYSCTLNGASKTPAENVSETLSQTKTYNFACARSSYNCSYSKNFEGGTAAANLDACNTEKNNLIKTYNNNLASTPTCSAYCARKYDSSSCSGYSGTSCPYCASWTQKTSTGTCDNKKPEGSCSISGSSCSSSVDCGDKGGSCVDIKQVGTCSNGNGSCTANSDCTYNYDVTPCVSYECNNNYDGYTLSATSKDVAIYNTSKSLTFRVIPEPSIDPLSPVDYNRQSKTKVLFNQAINMIWRAASSAGFTTFKCYPSSSPLDSKWSITNIIKSTGLSPTSPANGITLSPLLKTTTYNLFCRDWDNTDNQCYRNSDIVSKTVEVYTSEVQETRNR